MEKRNKTPGYVLCPIVAVNKQDIDLTLAFVDKRIYRFQNIWLSEILIFQLAMSLLPSMFHVLYT